MDLGTGVFHDWHTLPALPGQQEPVQLWYRSDTADPSALIGHEILTDVTQGVMRSWSTELFVGGEYHEMFFSPRPGANAFLFHWGARDRSGGKLPTGSYPYTVRAANNYVGIRYSEAPAFGDAPTRSIPGPFTLGPVARTNTLTGRLAIVNRRASPFGAGWGVTGVSRLHFDPDGPIVVEEGDGRAGVFELAPVLYTTSGGSLIVLNSATREVITTPSFPGGLSAVVASADGHRAFVASERSVYEVAPPRHDKRFLFEHPAINAAVPTRIQLAPTPDGERLLVVANASTSGSMVSSYDLRTGVRTVIVPFTDMFYRREITSLAVTPDGKRAYAVTSDGSVRPQWFVTFRLDTSPVHVSRMDLPNEIIRSATRLALSPDGRLAAVCSRADMLLVDTSGPSPVFLGTVPGLFNEVAFTPDGSRLLGATSVGLFVYNVGSDRCTVRENLTIPLDGGLQNLTVSPDGKTAWGAVRQPLYQPGGRLGRPLVSFDLEGLRSDVVSPPVDVQGFGFPGAMVTSPRYFTPPKGDFSTFERLDDGTFVRSFPNGEVVTYSSEGLQIRRRTAGDRITTYGHDNQRRLTTITLPGQEGLITFAYGAAGLTSITNGTRVTSFEIDDRGRLVKITDPPGGGTRTYVYDPEGRMTSKVDPTGSAATIAYGERGTVTEVVVDETERSGLVAQWTQGLLNRLSGTSGTVEAPTGTTLETASLFALFTNRDGGVERSVLDRFGHPIEEIDPSGRSWRWIRDASGLVRAFIDPENRKWEYTYSAEGVLTSVREPTGDTFSRELAPIGGTIVPVLLRAPSGASTLLGYSSTGQHIVTTDAEGRVTQIDRDVLGLPTRIRMPTGRGVHIDRTPFGAPSLIGVSPTPSRDGLAGTTIRYDAARDATEWVDSRSNVTSAGYNGIGLPTSVRDPDSPPFSKASLWGISAFTRLRPANVKQERECGTRDAN